MDADPQTFATATRALELGMITIQRGLTDVLASVRHQEQALLGREEALRVREAALAAREQALRAPAPPAG